MKIIFSDHKIFYNVSRRFQRSQMCKISTPQIKHFDIILPLLFGFMSMIICCRENPRGKRCRSTCEETNESKTETDETTGKIIFLHVQNIHRETWPPAWKQCSCVNENISYDKVFLYQSPVVWTFSANPGLKCM